MTEAVPPLPQGFLAAGINCGIKNSKRDLGVIVADAPANFAACVTTNKSRAHSINRTERLRAAGGQVRAVVATSGNANALTGPLGAEDDEALAAAFAERLGIAAGEVVTAATGVIGHRPPIAKAIGGLDDVIARLGADPLTFAESIMTTDRVTKIFSREVFIAGTRVRLHAIAKGAGMISPAMATTLCFVTTDAVVSQASLQDLLAEAVAGSFNQLTVDNDMSTNDVIVALANGYAENDPIEEEGPGRAAFAQGLSDLLVDVARSIARDGEGATRLFTVEVRGAATVADARAISAGVAGSMLVKSAVFGADPYVWGRIVSAAGAKAATAGAAYDTGALVLELQGVRVFERGMPVPLPDHAHGLHHRMTEPEVVAVLDLGAGEESARAFGCDLTYDYVKINADYASVTTAKPDGSVSVDERLREFGPSIKKKLLIEGLRYISRFQGMRAVIKLGGAAMIEEQLEDEFAEDLLLLTSVGLRPIVVHGGGPEISRIAEQLGHKSEFVDGLRVTDERTMGVVEMVLTGKLNQRIVAALNREGSKGVGLSGKDGSILRARKLGGPRDLGRVGEIAAVDTALIEMLLDAGRIPVISPVALGEDGDAYNINADVAAAELAVALSARKLIFLSDVPGLLDGDLLVTELDGDQLKLRIEGGQVTGGMLPKAQSALRALRGGVEYVHLVDGRVPHNLIAELFTDKGVGTLIRKS